MTRNDFYTDKELAELLQISLGALRNKISAGERLPPRIQVPGCKYRLWKKADVHAWLDRYTVAVGEPLEFRALISSGGKRK